MADKAKTPKKKNNLGKMVLTGLGGLIVVVVLAVAAFKVFVITPVSPAKICAHAFELMAKEASQKMGKEVTVAQIQQISGVDQAACIEDVTAQQKNKVQGLIRTTKRSKCEVAAPTMKAFNDCALSNSR